MASAVEWIGENHAPVQWLGQIPTTTAAAASSQETILREELRRERERLTTTDKVLIASLLLSVVSFAWGVYTWQKTHQRMEEAKAA